MIKLNLRHKSKILANLTLKQNKRPMIKLNLRHKSKILANFTSIACITC